MEGVVQNWSNAKLCDVANLVLGALLFFSPWIFGFEAASMSQNATTPVSRLPCWQSARWLPSKP
jgi:hypothetical protein